MFYLNLNFELLTLILTVGLCTFKTLKQAYKLVRNCLATTGR